MMGRASHCSESAPPRSQISSRWRGIGMDNYAARTSHHLICQPPWRERLLSEQPGSRWILGRGSPSAPDREETVPTGFPPPGKIRRQFLYCFQPFQRPTLPQGGHARCASRPPISVGSPGRRRWPLASRTTYGPWRSGSLYPQCNAKGTPPVFHGLG
jgi:hypothetical protein